MKNVNKILYGLGLTVFAGSASAGTAGGLTLTDVSLGSTGGTTSAWSITGTSYYHNVDGSISQVSAQTAVDFRLGALPSNGLFTHYFSGMTLDGGGGHSTTAYQCIDGFFGSTVGAHLCGNYTFGGNFFNESTVNYNTVPGTRTMGGDDVALGPMQQASDYGCIIVQNDAFVSGNVVCQSAAWIASPGAAGMQMTFHHSTVPVPAAVWLFGSALGMLGWMRRKAS